MEETEASGEFNLHEAADEIIAQGDSQAESVESSPVEGQAETASLEKTTEAKELSPEEILKQVAEQKESPEQFAEILKGVNSLGMIRNGQPVSVDSPEQLKELIQKGFDYTQKTMEHAELVKTKEAEFQQKEAQYKEVESQLAQKEQAIADTIQSNQILGSIIQRMQTEDPELFQLLDQMYRKEESVFLAHKPLEAKFEGKIKQLESKLQQFEGTKKNEELNGIKQGWEKELSDLQTKTAASLNKLGVKTDWEKVKTAWMADASNTMTVEQALYAVHGKDIVAANESYAKLLKTKSKTQSAMLNRTGVGGGGAKGQGETIKAASPGDYESILKMASSTM